MQLNTDLVTLLILYVIDQDELYVDYHDGFTWLIEWLYDHNKQDEAEDKEREKIYLFPRDNAPDICCECLFSDTMVSGGRVREGCPECEGLLPYKDKVLRTIWKWRFCELLQMNEAYFDYHLAYALNYIRQRQGSNQRKDKEQSSKESV